MARAGWVSLSWIEAYFGKFRKEKGRPMWDWSLRMRRIMSWREAETRRYYCFRRSYLPWVVWSLG